MTHTELLQKDTNLVVLACLRVVLGLSRDYPFDPQATVGELGIDSLDRASLGYELQNHYLPPYRDPIREKLSKHVSDSTTVAGVVALTVEAIEDVRTTAGDSESVVPRGSAR